jgi:hypothetical protein
MELNHQIRLCRPFPFLFGFRALLSESRYQPYGLALEFASPNVAEQHKQRHTIFAERLLRVTFRLSTEVVISMACFGKADHKITVTAKARFGNRNHLSEMPTFVQVESHPLEISKHYGVCRY